jgi:hypothetical protein
MASEKQTTFGAIVERKPKPQSSDDTDSLVRGIMQDPINQHTHIKPALHLNSNSNVDPPLPSPYSFSDPVNDQPDLETGLAYYEDSRLHSEAGMLSIVVQ